ncbi:MAG: ATP synthase F1 subunit delta [Bacteroidetes bacterium]|nr:ATP synthase F1 subunit delta [Bacteroidota bacterium]
MSNYNVSTRYAKALLDLSTDTGMFEKVSEDVEVIYKALSESRELRTMLLNPVIREEKKVSVLSEIFKSHISDDTMKFMKFVVNKSRGNIIKDILRRFIELKNDRLGIIEVGVVSNSEMTDVQKNNLEMKMKERTGKSVILSYNTDESLIGGFRLKLKDTIIDASVKHQLEELRKSFLGEKMISTN